jgi:predicted NAD/FAD-binding protein
MTYRPSPADRVGIVGGGAAGLSAALALARAGYRRVTVLEAADRVGGKCCTFQFQDRSYELGAGALTSAYKNVRALMREHDVRAEAGASGLFIDVETRASSFVWPPLKQHSAWRVGWAVAKLLAAVMTDRRLHRPGLDGTRRELAAPFAEWARARGVAEAAALVEPWFTGFGYGYFDEVPAAYVLKYIALFRFPIYEILDGGYQGLWERAARGLDVRLSARVQSITRADQITVESAAGRFTFDALVLACPLDAALAFLDADEEERALLSRIRLNDYHVVAARIDGAPRARYGFFPRHLSRAHAGQPMFFYRRWLDRDLTLFYALPPDGATLDDSVSAVRATVERLGARVASVERTHAWRYFPHVSPHDFASGWYERFEARQGRRRTFYCGEVGQFSAVEPVVAYSRALVERCFAA